MSLIPSCKDVTEHSSDYLDRNLTLLQRAGYKMHLFMCVHCRDYVKKLKLTISTINQIGQTPEASPPVVDPQQVHEIVRQLQQHKGNNSPQG